MNIAALVALSLSMHSGASTPTMPVVQKKGEVKQEGSILDRLPLYVGPKKRIAVADVEVKVTVAGQGGAQVNMQTTQQPTTDGGQVVTQTIQTAPVNPPTDMGTGLREMLVTALSRTNRFVMLERSDLGVQDIAKEQTQAGVSEQTRAAANNLLGAEMLVRGAVTEFAYSGSGNGAAGIFKGLGIGNSSVSSTVTLDIRLFDASTGEIYDSEKATGSVKSTSTQIQLDLSNLHFQNDSFKNSSLGQAARQAIEKAVYFICHQMDTRPWEGRIADVVTDEGNGTELYLNVGQRSGIKVGDVFEVYTAGHVIMDPDNPGRVLAKSKGKRIGKCKVTSVDVNISVAAPLEGDGFEAKCVLRLPGSLPVFLPNPAAPAADPSAGAQPAADPAAKPPPADPGAAPADPNKPPPATL